ncbi:hypothetical protein GOP47_0021733 [Adiantum capillus-veneris]|uniref:NB-ARC domain-containing protein n=1 Tax=Adiantum capillus-veneris TaxID=13818 RepID=A0A9D4U7Z9_ADICA|nr:hypothetical protein GOP47_0021733 [Adiantum capillus-veneris]
MAETLLLGALVGAAINDLYAIVKDAVVQVAWCHRHCQALQRELDKYQPMLLEMCSSHLDTPPSHCEQVCLQEFLQTLQAGRTLLVESQCGSGWAHLYRRFRYSRKILKLQQDILKHIQQLLPLNVLQAQQIKAGLKDVQEHQVKHHEELMDAFKSGNTNMSCTVLMSQCGAPNTSTAALGGPNHPLDELIIEDQKCLVGLDKHIHEVKSLLLSNDGKGHTIMIVGGMGGIGKTTLALSICQDPEVREFYEDCIHFVTVSQSPDMKSLFGTIWKKVVGGEVPSFQSVEDASRQIKGRLISYMPSKRRLLVLDDVWYKAHLEILSFEAEGFKTMITTRQASLIETRQSLTYKLDVLTEKDAESLFCHHAFGQCSIPTWVEDTQVVKEVVSECGGLPLALKVIGASLSTPSGETSPTAYWRVTRDKLRDAKPLGEYQKDALMGRLQTSVDALDPVLRECFLDLGAYPEDSRWSANTLLDIWVYVRGMEWVDAVLALAELGSRCLLDLTKGSGRKVSRADIGYALESNNAHILRISQHDVMRDLALQLGAKDHPPYSHCKRLLMPQQGKIIPSHWHSEEAAMAEVISIHTTTGTMTKPTSGLAFPHARALLYYAVDGFNNHLPRFITIGVISVRWQ